MTDRPSPAWVTNALLALGFLICIGALGAYLLFGRSADKPVVAPTQPNAAPVHTALPTPRGPTGFTAPPIPPPPTVPAPPVTATPGQRVSISGIDENRTVTCAGGEVEVSGIRNTVVLIGHCGLVDVSGIDNVVTADGADRIEASGIRNRVTFHTGSPQIDAASDNVVTQG